MQRRRRPDLNINVKTNTSPDYDEPQTPPNRKLMGNPRVAPSSSNRALKQPSPNTAHGHTHAKHAGGGAFFEDKTPTTLHGDGDDDDADDEGGIMSTTNANSRPTNGTPSVAGPSSSEPRRPNPRDSHDLSLSPRNVTRDSLVTNMLLSLDQFSMGQMNTSRQTYEDMFGSEPATRTLGSRAVTSSGRHQGHEHSYSSDFEGADNSSQVSSSFSRGRRSNSSSNFQTTLGRINSLREPGQKSQPATPGHGHSRGGRGSKSSSSDAGYAQVLGSQRWTHGFGGGGVPSINAPASAPANGQKPWHLDFSNSFFSGGHSNSNLEHGDDDDYDAAPTPTVPGGPRRLNTVPSMPTLPHPKPMIPSVPPPSSDSRSPVRGPSMDGRRSTRSSRSATVGRIGQSKAAASRDVPPLPVPGAAAAFDIDSAPAPHVGYEKSKEPVSGATGGPTQPPQQQPAPQKEKLGFFRRVFGTRKDHSSSSDTPTSSSFSNEAAASQRGQSSGAQMASPPSRESQHSSHNIVPQQPQPQHSLQKKSSSFFRRQKKAPAQQDLPPPMPQALVVPPTPHRIPSPAPAERSPSLGRVLAPYLNDGDDSPTTRAQDANDVYSTPLTSPNEAFNESANALRGEPAPSCDTHAPPMEIKIERAGEHEPEQRRGPSESKPKPRDSSPVRPTPRIEIPNRRPPEPPHQPFDPTARTGSFLNDNSDSDCEELRARLKAEEKRARKKKSKESKLVLPIEGAVLEAKDNNSPASKSATSIPSVKVDESEPSTRVSSRMAAATSTPAAATPPAKTIDEPEFVVGDPTDDDKQKAQRIFEGNEDHVSKERAAAWMGEEGPVRQRTLRAYMALYDFVGRSIVASLREVCGRLILRAETQQVDRILASFAKRWCESNPSHGFKAIDVVHTICYSIMLLNTDLHLADIDQKMTRSQFVKNTMGTIRQSLADAAPDAFGRQTILPGKGQGPGQNLGPDEGRQSLDHDRPPNNFRHSFLAGITNKEGVDPDDCGPLVTTPFEGTLRAWEAQVETVLKNTYASIRDERLPLFGATAADPQLHSQSSLSVMGMLKRSPSVLSKAPSEGHGSTRGRVAEQGRLPATLRWTSKSRSRARAPFQPPNAGFSSSRTSFEDNNSMWSPTVSSATRSRYSLGRTQTSMSYDSFGSAYPNGSGGGANFHQSIGFANALSQAIIREDALAGSSMLSLSDDASMRPLLDDESLELAGPPWVKEGRVIHKHHLDGIDKKAKDRNWTEVFAVIQKGTMSLFSFTPNKSLGKKSRSRAALGGGGGGNSGGGGLSAPGSASKNGGPVVVVGGGNWQENATNLGTFSLKQTLASALPPPGYSAARPHVWALSLPTGAVHLFQVGTPEISKEFVLTANYWSARLSTHPLVGGVSNMEYGWSEAIINNPMVTAIAEATANGSRPGTTGSGPAHRHHQSRGSLHSRSSSFRSGSLEFMRGRSGSVQSRNDPTLAAAAAALTEGAAVEYGSSPPLHSSTSLSSASRANLGSSGGVANMSGSIGPVAGKLPGDKVHIAEWRPPAQSLRPSTLPEPEQLNSLMAYVSSIEDELRQHNALRSPMLLAFSPRGSNGARAMANWQRKSEYLLRESVKYRTYVDALHEGATRREEVYDQRQH